MPGWRVELCSWLPWARLHGGAAGQVRKPEREPFLRRRRRRDIPSGDAGRSSLAAMQRTEPIRFGACDEDFIGDTFWRAGRCRAHAGRLINCYRHHTVRLGKRLRIRILPQCDGALHELGPDRKGGLGPSSSSGRLSSKPTQTMHRRSEVKPANQPLVGSVPVLPAAGTIKPRPRTPAAVPLRITSCSISTRTAVTRGSRTAFTCGF